MRFLLYILWSAVSLLVIVLVAVDTRENFAIKYVRVAYRTVIPIVSVLTRKDGEKRRIVLAEVTGLTGGVALVACRGGVDVIGITLMFLIHFLLVVLVAVDAFERLEVARNDVAIGARIPSPVVRPGIDGKERVVVGHEGRVPSRHLVAVLTEGRETGGRVLGARRRFVIRPVAVVASCPDTPEIGGRHAGMARKAVYQ